MKKPIKIDCPYCSSTGISIRFVGHKKCPICKGKGYKVVKKTPENYLELEVK